MPDHELKRLEHKMANLEQQMKQALEKLTSIEERLSAEPTGTAAVSAVDLSPVTTALSSIAMQLDGLDKRLATVESDLGDFSADTAETLQTISTAAPAALGAAAVATAAGTVTDPTAIPTPGRSSTGNSEGAPQNAGQPVT